MNIILIPSLLGVAAFVVQVASSKEVLQVSVSVWPPGSHIYLGECVLLLCSVDSDSSFVWSYRWFRHKPHTTHTLNPRHLLSGDSYSITAVTRADAGSYWCQVQWRDSNTTTALLSQPATLRVSELPPPTLTLTPTTRQIFRGERLNVQCPVCQTNSSGWVLRLLPHDLRNRARGLHSDPCSPLVGAVSPDKPPTCVVSEGSGLYWCEGGEARSNAINITVSDGTIILKSPAFAVSVGDMVVLSCRFRRGNHSKAIFFKNDIEIIPHSSASTDRVISMTIENVTQAHEGFYKCASQDRKTKSPESWLSVRRNPTSADATAASTQGSWHWVVISCGIVLLFLISLTAWLAHRHRHKMFCNRSCWTYFNEELPAAELPATKQDVTEVQWDLSWMEMSNLLDKQQHPGT